MLRLANIEPDESDDDAVTVAVAARRLGCAPSTVRDLLDCGELTGHKVGKTAKPGGVRVHVSSIRAYKRQNVIGGARRPVENAPPMPRPAPNPAAAEARRELRKLGIL